MISAPLVLVMGSDHIITVDQHAYQIQGAIVTCHDFYKSLLFHSKFRGAFLSGGTVTSFPGCRETKMVTSSVNILTVEFALMDEEKEKEMKKKKTNRLKWLSGGGGLVKGLGCSTSPLWTLGIF